MDTIEFWTKQYQSHLKVERGMSDLTVKGYGDNLKHFTQYIRREHDNTSIELVIMPVCRQYLYHLGQRGLKPKSIRRELCALRGFITFLSDEGMIRQDFGLKLVGPKVTERRADPLTGEEAARFLSVIPRLSPVGQRDRILFAVMLSTGLRLSEILNLQLQDFRADQRMLVIRHGKGDKDRIVPLTTEMSIQLQGYVRHVRPAFVHKDSPPLLFISTAGGHFNQTSIRGKVKSYAKSAGLGYRSVHPHTFRATFATKLAQASVNITVIQELMGHSDIKTTAMYVGVARREMREAIETMEKT